MILQCQGQRVLVQDVESHQLHAQNRKPNAQSHAIRHLLLLWAAFVLRHAQLLLTSPSLSNPSRSNGSARASTRNLVSITADIREQVRGSLLSGGHVVPACASLLSLFRALAGRIEPSTLLALPDSLCHPELLVPPSPLLTKFSWQSQLLSSLTVGLLCRLPYASLHHVHLVEAASKTGVPGEDADAIGYVLHNWPHQSLVADVIIQEFAAAVGAFTTLPGLQNWADSATPVAATASHEQDYVSPFMFAFQHVGMQLLLFFTWTTSCELIFCLWALVACFEFCVQSWIRHERTAGFMCSWKSGAWACVHPGRMQWHCLCQAHLQFARRPWFFSLFGCIQGSFATGARAHPKGFRAAHVGTCSAGACVAVAGSIARSPCRFSIA